MTDGNERPHNRWPHRVAVLLACAVFPLIWIGGTVTTEKAGMAVPDWPTTFGYNPLAYPLETWLHGPADVWVEHGHRLYAGLINLLVVAVLLVLWRCEPRRGVRRLGLGILAALLVQDLLGGLRVVLDAGLLAKIHACVGPAFFALCGALAVVTSSRWQSGAAAVKTAGGPRLRRLAIVTTLLVYVQILLGAQVRHVAPWSHPSVFRGAVLFHLFAAAVLLVHVAISSGLAWKLGAEVRGLRWPGGMLGVLLLIQLVLGPAAWVQKYGWPGFASGWVAAEGYVVQAAGSARLEAATAHVAVGSLMLLVSLTLALRAMRLLDADPIRRQVTSVAPPVLREEVAQ